MFSGQPQRAYVRQRNIHIRQRKRAQQVQQKGVVHVRDVDRLFAQNTSCKEKKPLVVPFSLLETLAQKDWRSTPSLHVNLPPPCSKPNTLTQPIHSWPRTNPVKSASLHNIRVTRTHIPASPSPHTHADQSNNNPTRALNQPTRLQTV